MMSLSHAQCDSTIEADKNFLLVKCALCAKDMLLTEGSVIFGSKWYHGNCFDDISRSKSVFVNDPKIHREIKNTRTE